MAAIHKAKDNSVKLILGDHELFSEFLRDFVKIDILSDIDPADIEDVTERFLPLFNDQKDSDVVKRVNLKGEAPFFVISIVEHESEVNYRASFKMLQYIALVLNDYEKEINGENKNASYSKDFKYPPVLPIVFYDGASRWTAETNFLHRTEMSGVFEKYIPKFEYELVDLSEYGVDDLVKFGDALSLIMIIDKIRAPDEIRLLRDIPADYVERLSLNIPDNLKKLISDVVTVLLSKINVPREEIDTIVEKIEQRGIQDMFAIENYDVQETRRIARSEGMAEGMAVGMAEGKIEAVAKIVVNMKISVKEAMRIVDLPEQEQKKVINELKKQEIPYILE